MQVVSGSIGHEKIHFTAPPALHLKSEMSQFLSWWRKSNQGVNGIIRAGIAHFYFVTLHPFDDGNGRLARVITDMALAEDDSFPHRYYSMSQAIVASKAEYYNILEISQKGNSDITKWLSWFMQCLLTALSNSDSLLKNIFIKTTFWQKNYHTPLNQRQQKVINKMLDAGQGNFVGDLTTRKYIGINHNISRRTAIREIQDLVQKGLILKKPGQGRNVSYDLIWPQ